MVRVEITTDIDRPIEEVFAYVTDPWKAPEWVGPIVETKSADPLGVGAKAVQLGKFLGRKLETTWTVAEYDLNRRFVFEATSPLKMRNEITFSPRGGGTRIDAVLEGEPGTFFRLAEPIVGAAARRQFAADYANLKELLEAGIATGAEHKVQT